MLIIVNLDVELKSPILITVNIIDYCINPWLSPMLITVKLITFAVEL